MKFDLQRINVLYELDRCGVRYESTGGEQVKCTCPFHEDVHPSCSVSVSKRVFKCHSADCRKSGDVVTFLARLLESSRYLVMSDLAQRYGMQVEAAISPKTIERWHLNVWQCPYLPELTRRGVGDATIRRYRLGFNRGRITIPIANAQGEYVNVRQYLPGAPPSEKMRNSKGRGRAVLWPLDQLEFEKIVVCAGEIKALAVLERLNEHRYGAVTSTGGEGTWLPEFTKMLRGKTVWVLYDIDAAGKRGAKIVATRLGAYAKRLGVVKLPLDPDRYPNGDVNDYLGGEGATAEDLLDLLARTAEWKPTTLEPEPDAPTHAVSLSATSRSENVGRRLQTRAVVSAMDTAPYVVPREIRCSCERDQELCTLCPIYAKTPDEDEGYVACTIPEESSSILAMVNATKRELRDCIREGLRIPECKSVRFTVKSWYNVEDCRLSPQLEISSRATDRVFQHALIVEHGLEMNEPYEFLGRMYPHPRTQQSTLILSSGTPVTDSLAAYKKQGHLDDLDDLDVFRPRRWKTDDLAEKLDEIYADLEANVTRIFRRRDMHLVVDLAYHSPLLIVFDGRRVKGWVEVLVVGDSSQGKSDTAIGLMGHYGLGEKVECKNATVAGLLGGLQQIGGRWYVTWGVIPTHDSRLVVLEELKGASTEVLSKLTDMRSSGVAEIPKIEKRRTHARTRLVALSNPRRDVPMSSYNYGVDVVRELMGGLEDVRRFDAVVIVTAGQISADEINVLQVKRPRVEHVYTEALCRKLVLWAWTLDHAQVAFSADVTARVLEAATAMCDDFSETIPIVDRGSMRYKIARLAAALAGRTFSRQRDALLVRACHVEFITDLLRRVYSDSHFGYAAYSHAVRSAHRIMDPELVSKKIIQTPFPVDFIDQILEADTIRLTDIQDWCAWERPEAAQLLSLLVRKHALRRESREYKKTSTFIELLKGLRESPKLEELGRPDHIREEF